MNMKIILKLAAKAMNNIKEPEGLVPSSLVFGSYSDFPQQNLLCQCSSRERTLYQQLDLKWILSLLNFESENLPYHVFQEAQIYWLKSVTYFESSSKQTNDMLDPIPSSVLLYLTCSSLTTIAKSISTIIKYFQPSHTTTSYLECTLWLHCIHRSRNYRPIVHADLVQLTAKRYKASSLRIFNVTMIFECEVSKHI